MKDTWLVIVLWFCVGIILSFGLFVGVCICLRFDRGDWGLIDQARAVSRIGRRLVQLGAGCESREGHSAQPALIRRDSSLAIM